MIPWYMYDVVVPFGNPNFDSGLGGSHDMDVKPPPNYPVTALASGTISDISNPSWGWQVCYKLDSPIQGVPYMGHLHLSAANPSLRVGNRVSPGTVVGWVGGGSSSDKYLGTSNPTGSNFINDPSMSSQIQAGLALHRGAAYGGAGWENFPPVDWALDPTPTLDAARSAYMVSKAVQLLGRIGLFFGVETANSSGNSAWSLSQWQQAAEFCVAHKINYAIIKVFEITQGEWYQSGVTFPQIASEFMSRGVAVLPYGFLYGGAGLSWEIGELEKFMANYGAVCADMEGSWWSGNSADAQTIASALKGKPGLFLGSIPANPDVNTFRPLAGTFSGMMPMSYDDFLVSVTAGNMSAIGGAPVYPTLDLSGEFGANNLVANAQWARGYDNVSLWEYGFATANTSQLDQLVSIIGSFPAGGQMGVPTGWTDDGTTLHNPSNSNVFVQGFRQHVISASPQWPSWDVPLENENGVASVEESNTAVGAGSRQATMSKQLEYTTSRGVFEGWIGRELWFVRKDRDAKAAALAKAQSDLAMANASLASVQAQLQACLASGAGIPADLQAAINEAVSSQANLDAAFAEADKVIGELKPFVK